MNFILWTLVWWSIADMDRWLGILKSGAKEHFAWEEKAYSSATKFIEWGLNIFLWIYLFNIFVK